eukprot:Nitzschia sp. Nitz4//scaffold107_size73032//3530//4414//NITZ4_005750-RA/size73032-processed-gene-0.118-mRNA-1//-1//CDS//3329532563//8921//frame0
MEEETHKGSSHEKKPKRSLSVQSTVAELGQAFFECMDFDGNGFIEEGESIMLSIIAFDMSEEQAIQQWREMLATMDANNDYKISRDEYIRWWLLSSLQSRGNIMWRDGRREALTEASNPEDVIFEEAYAVSLLESLQRILSIKTAKNVCEAFFEAMDSNKNGYLEESEVISISKWAFGAKPDEAKATWIDMLHKMDTDHDSRVSKGEYSAYWMEQTKGKIQPDGSFVKGYRHFLLKKLSKIKNGNRRIEQVDKWTNVYSGQSSLPNDRPSKIKFKEDAVAGESGGAAMDVEKTN